MDALILLGSFIALILLRVPVAYSLGLSALAGAWYIDIPFHTVMIQIAGGVNKAAVLRRAVHGAAGGDLHSGHLAVAAEHGAVAPQPGAACLAAPCLQGRTAPPCPPPPSPPYRRTHPRRRSRC